MENLTHKENLFVRYLVQGDTLATAHEKAGYRARTKSQRQTDAFSLSRRPRVKNAIRDAKAAATEIANLDHAYVLKHLMRIVEADHSKISSVVKRNCRFCWGIDFKYQFTDVEYEERREMAESAKIPFVEAGGGGYTKKRPPHPDCPECGGEGEAQVITTATSELGPNERELYAGVENTRYGIKVKTHDKMQALIKLGEHLSAWESKTLEEKRQLELAKIEAETKALNSQQLPIKVEISVEDASNPDRVKGEVLNNAEPE